MSGAEAADHADRQRAELEAFVAAPPADPARAAALLLAEPASEEGAAASAPGAATAHAAPQHLRADPVDSPCQRYGRDATAERPVARAVVDL